MRSLTRAAGVSSILSVIAGTAAADTSIWAEQGAALANQWCAECHAVSAEAQPRALIGAPSFPDMAARGAGAEQNLRRKILGNHPIMPEFPVGNDEIRALSAYIATLAPSEPRARVREAPVHRVAATEPIAAGEELVAKNCSPCHAAEGEGPSPVPDAPVFATLSERYPVEHLAEALAEGILVGHPEVAMPEFVFAPDEVSAILAYLESIQAR